MIARTTASLPILFASLLLLAGCGGGSGSSGYGDGAKTGKDGSTKAVELGVEGNTLEFDTTELTAPAGEVTLDLRNTSTIQHDINIEDEGGKELAKGELVGKGETSTLTVDLEPGTYTYFCSPHRSSGMTGTLTVT